MEKKYRWIPPVAQLRHSGRPVARLSLPSSWPLDPLISQLPHVRTHMLVSLVAGPDLGSHW